MDWKYAHYAQEEVFEAPRERVVEATHAFAAEALADWTVKETAEGLEASGRSCFHAATATFRIEPTPGGTRVAVTLLVKRVGGQGFLLWDLGFYSNQVHNWLKGIRVFFQQGHTSANQQEAVKLKRKAVAESRRGERFLRGCALVPFFIILATYTILAIVGLLIGELYIPGSKGAIAITIHGVWARILSAAILLLSGWIVMRIWGSKKRNRGSA